MKFDNLINSKQTAIKLHESELRFKTVFEEASDGILIVDIQSMKFKYANPAICKMLGYASKDLQKLSIQDIHPKDRLDYVISEFKAQAQGIKKLAEDIPCLKKDGTIFFADINTTPVELSGTKYNMGFFRDISDKKAVGIEKENMQRTIFQASKLASIGQLAAGMSHEINNPLAIIQGYVEIINDEYAHNNSNLRELLKVVEDSIDRIKNTVNGLNTFAISGNESLQIIDLHKILHHCISIVEAIYEKGVFRPLEIPDISDGLKVRLEVETLPESSVEDLLELAAKVYGNLSDEQIDEIEQIAFDRDELFGNKSS